MLLLHMILFVVLAASTRAAEFKECAGLDDGTFIPSPRGCTHYIYCSGENSEEQICPDNYHFSPVEKSCMRPEEAKCTIGQENKPDEPDKAEESEETEESEESENPEESAEAEESEEPEESGEPEKSEEEEEKSEEKPEEVAETDKPEKPEVPKTTPTTKATTATTITTPTSTPSTTPMTTQSSSGDLETGNTVSALIVVANSCPNENKIGEVVLIPSKKSCAMYYFCHYGQPIELRCSQRLHFNPKTGMCDYPSNVGCSLNRPSADQCLPGVTDFFPHAGNCNYYYFCIKGFLTLQQCPFAYGWDVGRRTCVLMSRAKCYEDSRRGFNIRPTQRHYL